MDAVNPCNSDEAEKQKETGTGKGKRGEEERTTVAVLLAFESAQITIAPWESWIDRAASIGTAQSIEVQFISLSYN